MKSMQRSKRALQLAAALFLTLGCVFAFRVQADAAITAAPAGVKQTDATSSQALVEWSPVLGTAGEQIYYYVMYSNNVNFVNYSVSYPSNCYWVISGMPAGKYLLCEGWMFHLRISFPDFRQTQSGQAR